MVGSGKQGKVGLGRWYNIYFLSFQQHNIFIIIITEHARGLTANKDTPKKMIAHVLVDECHFRHKRAK